MRPPENVGQLLMEVMSLINENRSALLSFRYEISQVSFRDANLILERIYHKAFDLSCDSSMFSGEEDTLIKNSQKLISALKESKREGKIRSRGQRFIDRLFSICPLWPFC